MSIRLKGVKVAEATVWREAMIKEVSTSRLMRYFDKVRRPDNQRVIHTKFVFSRKSDKEGDVKRHMARLVIRGNEEDDYHEGSYSSVLD